MLGNIISRYSIKIYPSRVKVIQKIDIQGSKKEVQYFIGRVIFLRRFILNFAEIMKHISSMLIKDNDIKWTMEARKSFSDIKKDLTEAPILISPNFTKDFQISSFAYEHTIVGVQL